MFNYDLSHYVEKHRKTASIVSVVVFVLLVIIVVGFQVKQSYERQGKIAVPMRVVPSDMSVTLENGREVSGSTAYISPGEHTITFSKDGFETIKKKYRIETYNSPAIYIGIIGKSDEAKQWQKRHHNEYKKLEVLAAKHAAEYSKGFRERNPIVNDLPVEDPYFTISYRNVDDKSVRLTIWGTSPRYRAFALEHLRSLGYEPTDFKIDIVGFDNPLTKKDETK